MTKEAKRPGGLQRTTAYRIDPYDLHLFTAVLGCGTITDGARASNLSLSAASVRLKALEDAVGAQLLVRSKTGAVATPAGRALARHARTILADLVALHGEMGQFGRGLRGSVRLLCNTAALSRNLAPPIGGFLERHSDVDIELQELPSDAIVDALRADAGDIGIVSNHVDTAQLHVTPWLPDELVALVPPQKGRLRSIRFADLLDRPLVGLSAQSGLSRYLLGQARNIGRVPHHRVRMDTFAAVAQLVRAGVGVAVMPMSAAARHAGSGVRIVPLADAWAKRQLLICTVPRAHGNRAVIALVSLIESIRE